MPNAPVNVYRGVKALAVEIDVALAGSSRRTDGDIARSAEQVLQWVSFLPPGAVKVLVEGGWITLSGDVDWAYQRQAATNAVRYLMGVTGVSDQISIKAKVSLETVKSEIEAALKRRAKTDAQNIDVEVCGNDVTLTGSVHSWSERELATLSAWSAPGVQNVWDKMTVAY